jgi:hypothetical protein
MSTSERPGLIQLTPAAARGELRVLGQRPALGVEERARLERRAKLLAWTGNGWHLVEFAVALAAGIAAGSVALVGFGLASVALLIGLLLNALAGWWWADPVAALAIAAIAGKEGLDSWRGERCDCC